MRIVPRGWNRAASGRPGPAVGANAPWHTSGNSERTSVRRRRHGCGPPRAATDGHGEPRQTRQLPLAFRLRRIVRLQPLQVRLGRLQRSAFSQDENPTTKTQAFGRPSSACFGGVPVPCEIERFATQRQNLDVRRNRSHLATRKGVHGSRNAASPDVSFGSQA